MSQHQRIGSAGKLVDRGTRPLRRYAPLMALGAAGFAVSAILLLAQSGAGVAHLAEGSPGAAIRMPVAGEGTEVTIYAVTTSPDALVPEVACTLATRTDAFANFTSTGRSVTSQGRILNPVAHVTKGWRQGDTVTCSSTSSESLVLGRNLGSANLVQGLLCAFVASGAGIMALAGFASERSRHT